MKTEQEFLCEVIKRGNQKKAKRRAYISALTVCVCIAITAIAIPIINNQNAEPQKYQISGDVCIDFYKKADLMCTVKETTETVISDNASSASKSENDEVTIDQNNASGLRRHAFTSQNMVGRYTVTNNGFEVLITNARGEQKQYILEGNTITLINGKTATLTERQILQLKKIIEYHQNITLPTSVQDTQPVSYDMYHFTCLTFFINADRMCDAEEFFDADSLTENSTSDSELKSENNNQNNAEYNFQTQDMTGIYTVTDSGFEVAIINSRGEQKLYTLEKNVMNTNLGTVTELTDEQITELKNILEDK